VLASSSPPEGDKRGQRCELSLVTRANPHPEPKLLRQPPVWKRKLQEKSVKDSQQEIITEMCSLLDEQTGLLTGPWTLAGRGGELLGAHEKRNDRLRELCLDLLAFGVI
jgi:hypothetical protein